MHCATILVLPFQYSQIILMHYISFVGVYSSHFTLLVVPELHLQLSLIHILTTRFTMSYTSRMRHI